MSDLLASVKRSFYHEVLSYSDAEQMLEGKNGSNLFKESNVKPGMFVLSYNVWGIYANFRATFSKVYYLNLGLSATLKVHICWTHIPEWYKLTETGKFTLYQAD